MGKVAKYPEVKNINYAQVATDMLQYWDRQDVFNKSIQNRKNSPAFTFYEGPPSANGSPGIHHVMARTVKDIFCRFKTLQGYKVERKGGWDTHGLPVELQVEKELGIKKEDIGTKISIKEYNQKCREAVMRYKDEWDDLTQKMGYWVDLSKPYITFENEYIESLWWVLKELYKKNLLYKGYTVQPYSPAAGSGLSSHELNQPGTYKMVKDTSVVAQFKLIKNEKSDFLFQNEEEDVRILAWTTTPWTLPSNCALAVGEKIVYAKVQTFNPYTFKPVSVILAKSLLPKFFSEKAQHLTLEQYEPENSLIPYHITQEFEGLQLVGGKYEQLMPYVTNQNLEEKAFKIIPGDFVTTDEGTGIVHTASVFGADDFRVTQKYGIPSVMVTLDDGKETPLVDKNGKFVSEVVDFAGKYVKAEYYDEETLKSKDFKPTDVLIAIKLKEENKAFRVEKYEHSYPHCWRTDKPILYYPLDSWFIKTTAVKEQLIALNKTIKWKPESTGTGRFGHWLENLVDWNLSRSRFWGTPLPIWVTEDKTETKCIGSIEELRKEVAKACKKGFMKEELPQHFDLHRPYVDEVILVSDSGQKMYRELDLIDVWFDSGAMPYAQWHFPFENEKVFKQNFPADFIAEGIDQTRGWFFTLHAIATLLYGQIAFKNVIANGLVLDKKGNKMSKRLGNTIDPFDTLAKYGPDALRWYLISNANPWDNLKFDLNGVEECQRRFFATLTNTYAFFSLYANLDDFQYDENNVISFRSRSRFDRWIVSELQNLKKQVAACMDDYEPTKATRYIQEFVNNQLSNWYVRLSRKRFWKSQMNDDKKAAYETLFECLYGTAQLMSPFAPFYADWLYLHLKKGSKQGEKATLFVQESVHLTTLTPPHLDWIDENLNQSMFMAQTISSMVHSLRKKQKIKVRQPLQKILIPQSPNTPVIQNVESLIKSETNVKEIVFIEDEKGIITKKIKPNFQKLGKKYGAKLKYIAQALSLLPQDKIREIEEKKVVSLEVNQENLPIALDEVEIASEDIPGWQVATAEGLTVAMDITITHELKREGLARDLVNRIQNIRKNQGLKVQDKISIGYHSHEPLVNETFQTFCDYIKIETQALEIAKHPNALAEKLDIDGVALSLQLDVL